jgi:hypothetical protein
MNITYVCVGMFALACVRACLCPGAWMCACACVQVALLSQHATRMYHTATSFVAPVAPPLFSSLFHKWNNFRKKVIGPEIYVLICFTTFV